MVHVADALRMRRDTSHQWDWVETCIALSHHYAVEHVLQLRWRELYGHPTCASRRQLTSTSTPAAQLAACVRCL